MENCCPEFHTVARVVTMSSREIAELTGKDIAHVHRDIRVMLEQLEDDPELDQVREDKDARGYTTCFHLTQSLSMTLVSGYSVKLRKAIIDRWQELESVAAKPQHVIPVVSPGVVTMSSREIAELVESRHDSVKRTIETLSDKGVIVRPQAVDEQTSDAMGRPRTTSVYHLGKRDSLIVVAQLCPEFTARIVDRWQELEAVAAKPQHVIPQTLTEALRLMAMTTCLQLFPLDARTA